ncbi:hypothetical protein B566_EDAN016121 [Ephemera danica]|nr:hypothetical protein B566_EDAN016121 [Ephemera danica]
MSERFSPTVKRNIFIRRSMDISNKILNPALWPTRNYSATTLIQIKLILICTMVLTVLAADHEMEVNYDIKHYKQLHVNQTLELICKNKLNRDPPSWTYHSRLYRDPRMKLSQNVGESRLVIRNAQAEDAGQYRCSIEHEYNDRTFHFNRTIEVMANEIKDIKVEEEKDYIKLLCDVHAYPSATIIWKIVYDNKELNPKPEEPDLEDEYWVQNEEKVVVDKSEGRWTLQQYKGVNNAELIIADVTANDNGNYTCVSKSIAGEQSKDCTVTVTPEAAGAGKSSTATLDKSIVAETETDNLKKVVGLGGGTITVIWLASIIIIGSTFGTLIAFRWKKLQQKKEQEIKESPEGCSLTPNMRSDQSNV